MLDPEHHDLPEIVLSLLECLEASMVSSGAPDPVLASRTLAGQILRYWGGIQAYVPEMGSKFCSRFLDEIRTWCRETVSATGADQEDADDIALAVAEAVQLYFAGMLLRLPKDRWSYRADLVRRFNSHNQVDLCREFGITTSNLYKIVYEERKNGARASAQCYGR